MLRLLAFMMVVPVTIIVSIWNGFVLSQLWHWFLVPLGVPAIGAITGIGIAMITTFLTYRHDLPTKDGDGWESVIMAVMMAFFHGLIALILGYLWHLFL